MRKPAALAVFALVLSPLLTLARQAPAQAAPAVFADPAFARLWDRTDSLVASNQVTNRSWYWGPGPGIMGREPYAQAPGGTRVVQYFDKARMEINNPSGDKNSPWYVTTGLLVVDLVSGRLQVGDAQFINRGAADIVVAGDSNDTQAPSYASFKNVASLNNNHRATKQIGAQVTATINRAGQIGVDATKARDAGGRIIAYNDIFGHNIPSALWEFMNAAGVVNVDGQPTVDRPVMNWIFTVGYPISEPFWARVRIAGTPTDVMIQLFERRALVYIPSYRAPWNIQMANVGTHYYRWLYGNNGSPAPISTPIGPPPPVPPPPTAVPVTPVPPTPIRPPTLPPTIPPPPTLVPPPPAPPPPPPPVVTPGIPPSVDAEVTPNSGPVGTIFTVSARGFSEKEVVSAWLTFPNGAVREYPFTNRPNDEGRLQNIMIDSAGFMEGVWGFTLYGATSRHQSIAYFQVGNPPTPVPPTPVPPPPPPANTPGPAPTNSPVPVPTTPPAPGQLTVNPTSGTRTTSFAFVGSGFAAGEQVASWFVDANGRFWYPSNGRTLTATSGGQVSSQVVPNDAFYDVPPGIWTFHLHGITSGVDETVQFTIR
ncbi:MAG TPA: hypothetical protein VM536_20570 [Chloroflexia bacterium]|nr:hypothetical protein [Chloroflexia bacterium]